LASYEVQLKIVKRFEHESGSGVYAYHDLRRDTWFVEERDAPDQCNRRRWPDLTEEEAADVYLALIGDGTGWRDDS
jgi:hypothetical protein